MRKFVCLVVLLFFSSLAHSQIMGVSRHRKVFPSVGGAGITYITNAIGSGTGGTATTSTSLNVATGDKLIVFCVTNGGNNTITMSDTIGNTFAKGTHQNDPSIGNTDIFTAYSTGSNVADLITCANNNGANPNVIALQYRGGATSGTADVTVPGAGAGGGWATSTFNTSAANEVVVQCLFAGSNGPPAGGTIGGFTANVRVLGTTGNSPTCQDYIFTSAQTGITGVIFLPGTNSYNGQMVAMQ